MVCRTEVRLLVPLEALRARCSACRRDDLKGDALNGNTAQQLVALDRTPSNRHVSQWPRISAVIYRGFRGVELLESAGVGGVVVFISRRERVGLRPRLV